MKTLSRILVPRLTFARSFSRDSPIIRQTRNGPVEGIEQTSKLGKKFYAFRGIPYAEPPITGTDPYTGEKVDRRFKAPEPLKRTWSKNLKVHNFADSCIASSHVFLSDAKKSEDCLYLNVYVPAGGTEQKTVLVYIHGGGFTEGEATDLIYGPDFLLAEDNVVVLIQYRVGVFGFLKLGFGEYTGNMGLKDQQLALKWIQENIEHFSGKKDEILLFGQSSGAACVSYHMLNEESRKCFNRAFLLSGSAFNYYALSENNHLKRIQEYAGIRNQEQLVEYLKTVDGNALAISMMWNHNGMVFNIPWVPTIESPGTPGAFLTKTPAEIYESKDAPVLDTMFSFNSKEFIGFYPGLLRDTEPYIKQDSNETDLVLPFHGFSQQKHPKEFRRALEMLREAYYSDVSNSDAVKNGNIGLLSDINFRYGTLKNVILQTEVNKTDTDATKHKNTYLYRFSVKAGLNQSAIINPTAFDGADHGDEMGYIFYVKLYDAFKAYEKYLLSDQNESNVAYNTYRRMTKMITNFARTGNPSIENDIQFKSCKSPSEIFCHEITNDRKVNVSDDILEQLHYDTWSKIVEMNEQLRNEP